MIRRILVPLDGSEIAYRIVTQARRLLLRSDREVTFARVVPSTDGLDEVRHELDRIRDGFAIQAVRASYRILVGDPAEQIQRFAFQYLPDIIAISASGHGAARGRGRIAEEVLRTSPIPVLLSNPLDHARTEELGLHRILVPLDGTEGSGRILPLVAALAHDYASEVVLLHVVETPSFEYPSVRLEMAERDARPLIDTYRARLGLRNVRVRVALGSPAEVILGAIREERADLLAMTTHGEPRHRGSPYGSVAERVVSQVRCPLLLARTAGFAGELQRPHPKVVWAG